MDSYLSEISNVYLYDRNRFPSSVREPVSRRLMCLLVMAPFGDVRYDNTW